MTSLRPTLVHFPAPESFPVETYSPFCLKVHRAFAAAALEYDSRPPTSFGEVKTLSRRHQLPVVELSGGPLPDSTAIIEWIEAQSPNALVPSDADVAAGAWLWEELADTAVNGLVLASRWADEDNWPRLRDAFFGTMPFPLRSVVPALIRRQVLNTLWARDFGREGWDACWRRLEHVLDRLDACAPEAGFWCGTPAPSVADVALFGQLASLRTPLTPRQSEMVDARPRLAAWLERVDAATRRTASASARAAA